jgi:hypothetical protein
MGIKYHTRAEIECTPEECKLIDSLNRLAKKWEKDGKRLWLYSASGVLTVMMHGDREDNPISLKSFTEECPHIDIELCKKEFFLLDEELESFKEFLNDSTKNIYHSIDGVKIVKSENGGLCGVGRIPHRLRTL